MLQVNSGVLQHGCMIVPERAMRHILDAGCYIVCTQLSSSASCSHKTLAHQAESLRHVAHAAYPRQMDIKVTDRQSCPAVNCCIATCSLCLRLCKARKSKWSSMLCTKGLLKRQNCKWSNMADLVAFLRFAVAISPGMMSCWQIKLSPCKSARVQADRFAG